MYESEKKFVEIVRNNLPNTQIINKTFKLKPYSFAMNVLKHWLVRATLVMGYEVKLNKNFDKYPDFILLGSTKTLRVEVKDKCPELLIAQEINAISKIDTTEFWFVIKDKNLDKIRRNLRDNLSDKIKVYSFDNIGERLKGYFN